MYIASMLAVIGKASITCPGICSCRLPSAPYARMTCVNKERDNVIAGVCSSVNSAFLKQANKSALVPTYKQKIQR